MIDHLWVFPKSQLAGHRGPLSLDSQLWSTSRPFARGHPCVIHHQHHHHPYQHVMMCDKKCWWWNLNYINDTLWNDADAASDDDGDESMAWPSAYITSRAWRADQASLCAPINTGPPIIGDHRDDEYERDDDAIVYNAIIYSRNGSIRDRHQLYLLIYILLPT